MGAITDVNQIGVRSVYAHIDSFELDAGEEVNIFDRITDFPYDFMGTLFVNTSDPAAGTAGVAQITIWAGCASILLSTDMVGSPVVEALVTGNPETADRVAVKYNAPSATLSAYLSIHNNKASSVFISAYLMLDSFTLYSPS
jgi:hypothetical protein